MRLTLTLDLDLERVQTYSDLAVILYRIANDVFVNTPDSGKPPIRYWRTALDHKDLKGTLEIYPLPPKENAE